MNQFSFLMSLLILLQACDQGRTGAYPVDIEAEEKGPCGYLETESIGWNEQFDNGPAPSVRLADLEADCTSSFFWDTDIPNEVIVSPMSEELNIHVRVMLSHDDILLSHYDASTADPDVECPTFFMDVPATIELATEDGLFVDEGRSSMRYSDLTPSPRIQLVKNLEEAGGTLQLDLPTGTTGSLRYSVGGSGGICSGRVMLYLQNVNEHGFGTASLHELGRWQADSNQN